MVTSWSLGVSENKFRQIASAIESRIDSGQYPPNSRLPTHRDLAEELETTPATVAKAYKLLVEKNYVESFVGRGTFVKGNTELGQVIQAPDLETVYNFSILQPCLAQSLPWLQAAFTQASNKLSTDLIGYTEFSGHQAHRAAGVQWAARYGLAKGTPENTLLVDGAQNALSLLIIALTKPGDTIAVERLTYPGILAIASLLGRRVVGVDMDDEGMLPEHLKAVIRHDKPKLVVTIPSHQNPTGVTMPEARRKQIADVIAASDVWLVEDDVYAFLNSETIPAICNWIPEQSFHITSLSKAISPALRCGFIKVPDSQVAAMNAHIRANIWLSSPINYIAAAEMITNGSAFHVAGLQQQIARQRQQIAQSVLSVPYTTSHGYHIWLPLPDGWRAERFVMEAKSRDLIVSSGSYFCPDSKESDHIRLSLMSVSSDQKLEEGLSKLDQLLQSEINTLFHF